MNPLPQLRTVRDRGGPLVDSPAPKGGPTPAPAPTASSGPVTPSPRGPAATPVPLLAATPDFDHPRLPQAARRLLLDCTAAGMLAAADVPAFLAAVGDRIPNLNSRDRTGDALVHFGFLTEYQRTRAVGGQLHGMAFGPYRVLDRLGGGTVGVVFRGEHTFLKRPVAIKLLTADGSERPDLTDRFAAEARALAGLKHPHVVAAYDAGTAAGANAGETLHYLVLEPVSGGDLEEFVYANGPQQPAVACEWGRQAAAGVDAAHRAGLVHRDLKPSNLLLTESRGVKVADFGLVRRFRSVLTPSRSVVGTLEFLAPEQLSDPTTAGPKADVYGLAATLFWVLTGKLPYPDGLKPSDLLAAIRDTPPRRLREVKATVPVELDAFVDRMLARNPADRPTMPDVAVALARFASPTLHPLLFGEALLPDDPAPDGLRGVIHELEARLTAQATATGHAHAATLAALAVAVSARPGETPGHVKRVAGYARLLATPLAELPNWAAFADPVAVDELERAAAIHDLGLLAVPGDAADDRTHPQLGAAVLDALADAHGDALPFLRTVRAVVRSHHERWDGSGFPDGLAGEHIPTAARIVAVADAYDRLRSSPGGMTHPDAVAAVDRDSGTAFDPHAVAAFRHVADRFDALFATVPDVPGAADDHIVPLSE